MLDFMAARVFVIGKFQPVQRGRSGQGGVAKLRHKAILPRWIELFAGGGQERIPAQLRVIIQVLVTQGHGVKTLGQQMLQGMIDPLLLALVHETLGQPPHRPQSPVDLTQQHHAPVAGQETCGEIRDDLTSFQ